MQWVVQGRGGISSLTEGGPRQCQQRDQPGQRRHEPPPGASQGPRTLWPSGAAEHSRAAAARRTPPP